MSPRTPLCSIYLLVSLMVALAGMPGCSSVVRPSNPVVVKRAQMHMGTLVTITAVAENEYIAQTAVSSGFAEIRRLEELLSTWIPASELSRVNAAAGSAPVLVSPETLEVIQYSLQVAEMTDGGFNIAIGPAVEAWSVTDRQHIPTEA